MKNRIFFKNHFLHNINNRHYSITNKSNIKYIHNVFNTSNKILFIKEIKNILLKYFSEETTPIRIRYYFESEINTEFDDSKDNFYYVYIDIQNLDACLEEWYEKLNKEMLYAECTSYEVYLWIYFSTNNKKIDTNIYIFRKIENEEENIDKFKMDIDTNISIEYMITEITKLLLPYYEEDNYYDITFLMNAHNDCLTVYSSDNLSKSKDKDLSNFVKKLIVDLFQAEETYPINNLEIWIESERKIKLSDESNNRIINITKLPQYSCKVERITNNKRNYSTLSKNKTSNVINKTHKRYYTTDIVNGQSINIIPVINTKTKVKSSKIWIDFNIINNQDFEKFSNELFYSGKITPNTDYSLIVKIKKDDIFFTVGKKQEHFIFNSLNDEVFTRLFNKYVDLIEELFEEYDSVLHYSCDSILFEFRPVNIKEKLIISNLSEVKKEYPNLDTKTLTRDLDFFGNSFSNIKGSPIDYKVTDTFEENVASAEPTSRRKLEIINILDVENLDKFLNEFNSNISTDEKSDYFIRDKIVASTTPTKLYLLYRLNKPYIITVNTFDNTIIKRCFNIYGDLISKVQDTDNYDGTFTRVHRNSTTIYKDNSVVYSSREIKLSPIKNIYKSKKLNTKDWLPNSNIATLDLETYEDEGIAKCYAIGFYTNEFKECKTYYIEEDLDSTKLIHKCLTEMFKAKYNKNVFYVHNLGRFDAPFIIKALVEFNKTPEGMDSPYTISESTRNSDILKLTIKRRINNRIVNVTLQDSAAILPNTLRNLCKHYQVDTEKGFFPYDFCTKDTLFYIGKTPNIDYYNGITQEGYDSIYKDIWSLKDECLLYLNKDLISLSEVLVKVNKIFHLKYKIQMTESLTISGIAMKIFLNNHYDQENKPIPLVTNRVVWEDIYKAYYGGRVEVYNPKFKSSSLRSKNLDLKKRDVASADVTLTKTLASLDKKNTKLYYYDVNSLYPFASLNNMPGLVCNYVETYGTSNRYNLDLENLFGFFYCRIKSSHNYIGLLPKRSEEGRLTFPNGEWYDWYFSSELAFAKERGYEIEVIKGYTFNSIKDVFTSFVNKLTEMKVNANNPSERNVAKLILNSLIGRFGMDFLKTITKILDEDKHDLYSVTRVLKNSIELNEGVFLDTYKPGIDKETCENFGVDFIKALNMESNDEKSTIRSHNAVSIPVAAATLSYARVHMNKLIMYILDNKGTIYYTDTDSIVTNLKLPEDFIHKSELGKLKLEHEIIEGYFISDKTYAFINSKGEIIKKAKGVESKYLSFNDYKNMFNLKSIENATKTISKRDYSKGSVVIKTKKDIKLNVDHYTKRERIFRNGKWVGTKSIQINENEDDEKSINTSLRNKTHTFNSLPSNNKMLKHCVAVKNFIVYIGSKIDNIRESYKIWTLTHTVLIYDNINLLTRTLQSYIYIFINIRNIFYLITEYTKNLTWRFSSKLKLFYYLIFNNLHKNNIKDIFINLIIFILFIVLTIIILEFINKYLDFKNFNFKDYSITNLLWNRTENILSFTYPTDQQANSEHIIKSYISDSNYTIFNSNRYQTGLRPIHLNIYDPLTYVVNSTNSDSLNMYIENVNNKIKYTKFNFDYININSIQTSKKQYLDYIISDIWRNITSHSISNRNYFSDIHSIKKYSFDYLLDNCKSGKLVISTIDFTNILNNITSYSYTSYGGSSWDKLKLINFTFTESFVDAYHNSNTSLINPSRANDHIITFINNNNLRLDTSNNILNQDSNRLQVPSLTTPIEGKNSPILQVSPLTTEDRPSLNRLNSSDIIKWRSEIWKSRNRS